MLGLDLGVPGLAGQVAAHAFERGLVIETSGPGRPRAEAAAAAHDLRRGSGFGLDVIEEAVEAVVPPTGYLREAA